MLRRYFIIPMRSTLLACFTFLFVGLGSLSPIHAEPQDTPELFVRDQVDGITLQSHDLFWKTGCGSDLEPAQSRLKRIDTTGNSFETLYYPPTCQPNHVASANVAVDGTYVYWLAANGDLMRLARSATTAVAPTVILHTGLSSIGGFVSCCWIAVDNTYLYWNENRVIKRAPKAGGAVVTMATAGGDVRDLRPRGDGALFYREGRRLKILVPFGSGFAPISLSEGVADYALSSARVFWVTSGSSGYSVRSISRDGLDDQQIHYTSPSIEGLRGDTIAVDGTNVYWHEKQGTVGGPIHKKALSGGAEQLLTSNITMGMFLLSDGAQLFWTDYNTGIFRLPIAPTTPVTGDIRITGVEVTQAIQTFDDTNTSERNRVPLIGNKLTAVRVYVQATNDAEGPWTNVTGTVTGSDGTGVSVPFNHYRITVPTGGSDRNSLDDSFVFLLNPSATRPGARTLHAEIHSLSGRPETNLANNQMDVAVTFGPERTLTVYGLTYANTNAPPATCVDHAPNDFRPPWSNFEAHRSFTQNVFPLSTLNIIPLPGDPQLSFDNRDCDAYELANSWLDQELDRLSPGGHLKAYLLQPENGPGYHGMGCANPAGNCAVRGQDLRADPGPTMAQELAHSFGGVLWWHTFDEPSHFPRSNGSLGSEVGLRIGSNLAVKPGLNGSGNPVTFDIMSYSAPFWVSPYTYCNLLDAISVSTGTCPADVPTRMPPQQADRAPQMSPTASESKYLYVGGWVSPEDIVQFAPFVNVPSDKDIHSESIGKEYMVTLEDENGKILANYSFDLNHIHHPNDGNPATLFSAYLPWQDGTVSIGLRHNFKLIAERQASPNAPEVKFVTELSGTIKGKQKIEWTGGDADGDPLTYGVEYSTNDGVTWIPLNHDLEGTTYAINFKNLPGSKNARLRVLATDGVNTTIDEMAQSFAVAAKKPKLSLLGVKENGKYGLHKSLLLTASAYDWEDGAIANPDQFQWTLDGKAVPGNGTWLTPQLTPGDHTVQVAVQDSSGKTARTQVHFTIKNK